MTENEETNPIPAGAQIVEVSAEDTEEAESRAIARQMEGGMEVAEAYLYIIKPSEKNKLPKPIVGPTVDFKKQIVELLRKHKRADLCPLEIPPVVEDCQIRGEPGVRAVVGVKDRRTGVVHWAVAEEIRHTHHAATIALEKAIGKAYEKHPAYNRKMVARLIRSYLEKNGLNPDDYIITGGARRGEWDSIFARARSVGLPTEEVRREVREKTGRGLSEVETPRQAAAAVAAAEAKISAVEEAKNHVMRKGPRQGKTLGWILENDPTYAKRLLELHESGEMATKNPELNRHMAALKPLFLAIKEKKDVSKEAPAGPVISAEAAPAAPTDDRASPEKITFVRRILARFGLEPRDLPDTITNQEADAFIRAQGNGQKIREILAALKGKDDGRKVDALLRKKTFCGMILNRHGISRGRLPEDLTEHEADRIISAQANAEEVNRILDDCWAARGRPGKMRQDVGSDGSEAF